MCRSGDGCHYQRSLTLMAMGGHDRIQMPSYSVGTCVFNTRRYMCVCMYPITIQIPSYPPIISCIDLCFEIGSYHLPKLNIITKNLSSFVIHKYQQLSIR